MPATKDIRWDRMDDKQLDALWQGLERSLEAVDLHLEELENQFQMATFDMVKEWSTAKLQRMKQLDRAAGDLEKERRFWQKTKADIRVKMAQVQEHMGPMEKAA